MGCALLQWQPMGQHCWRRSPNGYSWLRIACAAFLRAGAPSHPLVVAREDSQYPAGRWRLCLRLNAPPLDWLSHLEAEAVLDCNPIRSAMAPRIIYGRHPDTGDAQC